MSRTRNRLAVLAAVAALLAAAVPAAAATYLAQSAFSAGDEGWRLTSTIGYNGPVSWSNTGGNPGGFIYGQDPDTGAFGFLAPAKFRGPMGAAFHHELYFDVAAYQQPEGPTSWLGISGTNGLDLVCDYASPAAPMTWYRRTVWMNAAAGWTVVGTGLAATDAQILSVLQDLDGLAICAEFLQGLPTDVSGLDNVTLTPEPATLALVALGGLALLRRR